MSELLVLLLQEYQRLMQVEAKFLEWKENNPDKSVWEYRGQRISRTRFERVGIMIRQIMIDYEKSHTRY